MHMLHSRTILPLGFVVLLLGLGAVVSDFYQNSGAEVELQNSVPHEFASIARAGLPNLYQLHQGIYSGGQPDGEEGFQQLEDLGIKTVISVDGADPDVSLASQFGLKYVHLPHGYNGIEPDHAIKLTKAVQSLDGPFYIHCHHGKHRSPAAAAVACVGLGMIESQSAIRFLESAGTSPHYRGLYRSVSTSKRISDEILNQTSDDFPSVAPATPLVQSMVAIEKHLVSLTTLVQANGISSTTEPDLDAAHEALLLSECFTELLRKPHSFGDEYSGLMKQGEERSEQLYQLLSADSGNEFPKEKATRIINHLHVDCRSCHETFRD